MSVELVRDTLAAIAGGRETVRGHGLVARIAKKTKLKNAECCQCLIKLYQAGEIKCEWVVGEPFGEVSVLIPIPKKVRIRKEWQEQVAKHLFPGSTKKLVSRPVIIQGRTHAEVLRAFEKLVQYQEGGLLLREVSSRLFWGLSKVLDSKEQLVAELLGLDECPFPEKPVSILVHMPNKSSKGVLFIENEVSFLAACQGRVKHSEGHILLYASGYKSGTPRLRKTGGSAIFFSASSNCRGNRVTEFNKWLLGEVDWPVFFWGDLDFSGMDILLKLKKVFPSIEPWVDGYAPMLTAIQEGCGHSPEEAKKEKQTDPIETGCDYADSLLLPALREHQRFLDQE